MRGKQAMRFSLTVSLALALGVASGCGSSAAPASGGSAATGTGGAAAIIPSPATGGSGGGTSDAAAPPPATGDASPATDVVGGGTDLAGAPASDGAIVLSSTGGSPADAGAAGDVSATPDGDTPVQADAGTVETGGGTSDTRGSTDGGVPDVVTAPTDGSAPAGAYACTLMIGIQATEEWYNFGFETMVDNSKWELIWVHSGFVELWANPNDPVWSTAVTSPCAQNPGKPDRVIFLALNFIYTTAAEWNPVVSMAVDNIKAKYPSAKRIELMSFIRAPGNNACPQAPAPRSTITPAQDDAMAMAAAANPGLVFVAPKFEAKTCSEFSSNPPHPSPAGVTAWVKLMADYYR